MFWGVGGQGLTSETYAVVNGERITDSTRRAFQNVTNGAAMDDDEAREVGGRVLDMLIEKRVVLQEARTLGLEVADEEVFALLARQDAFRGPDGKFIPRSTSARSSGSNDQGPVRRVDARVPLADKMDRVLVHPSRSPKRNSSGAMKNPQPRSNLVGSRE